MSNYEVGIVGAGIHGASVAHHLGRAGVATALFERATPAAGPTGRSSAVICSHSHYISGTAEVLKRWPGPIRIYAHQDVGQAMADVRPEIGPAYMARPKIQFGHDLPRTGAGYDVHRLVKGKPLWLCGVEIAHEAGLSGHSDADVAIHALVDALLGALAEGDIGVHFPPSDPQWKGAASHRFLAFARDRVAARGGEIAHVDVSIICEAPKIGPHREIMRARLSELLAIPVSRVSVKATTTERLGFAGRGEGIAAQAVATLLLPEL